MRYLEALGHAILTLHGAEGTHVRSVPHTEVFRGEPVWTGTVEVFALTDHPKAAICYAWGYPKPDDPARFDIVTVLGIPPVDSPQSAVKAGIVGLQRQGGNNRKR
jgi:hypothetical protein